MNSNSNPTPVQDSTQPSMGNNLMDGVQPTMEVEEKVNPVTGQVSKLVNGQWVPTGEIRPTSF